MSLFQRLTAMVAVIVVGAALRPAGAANYTVIAATGQATIFGPSVQFRTFSSPTIDSQGRVVFWGSLQGAGVTADTDSATWFGKPGAWQLVAREGDAVSGNPGLSIGSVFSPELNDNGEVALSAFVRGSGVTTANDRITLAGPAGSVGMIAREGDMVPGQASVAYGPLPAPTIGGSGQVAFFTSLTGASTSTDSDSALVFSYAGSTQLIAREGSQAPFASSGVVYGDYSGIINTVAPASVVPYGQGEVAFLSTLRNTNVSPVTQTRALISGTTSGLSVVLSEGDSISGGSANWKYGRMNSLSGNQAGRFAFISPIEDGTSDNHVGLFAGVEGDIKPVAVTGVPDSRLPSGYQWRSFSENFMNAKGDILFSGSTRFGATITSSLWKYSQNALDNIMTIGDSAPGTEPGTVYAATSNVFRVIGPAGHVAFEMAIAGPDVTDSNNHGVWASDPNGDVRLIMRKGDMIDIDGVSRQIKSVGFVSQYGGDGPRNAFNASGQLALLINFTDDTQAMVLAVVPEPSSAVLACLGLAAFCTFSVTRKGRKLGQSTHKRRFLRDRISHVGRAVHDDLSHTEAEAEPATGLKRHS